MMTSPLSTRFRPTELKRLPRTPGVYRMWDAQGALLYIGKAVNLRARLQSYFRPAQADPWVGDLVRQIAEIEILPYGSELEALLEEARLIRECQPYFNRMLKNSKKQAYLRISDGPFPRLSAVLEPETDGATYLGPFPSRRYLENRFPFLQEMLQLRSCSDVMLARHQRTGNPCLEATLGRCGAPCVGLMSQAEYQGQVDVLLAFLSGQSRTLLERCQEQQEAALEALEYEQAAKLQARLMVLDSLERTGVRLVRGLRESHGVILLPDVRAGQVRVLLLVSGAPTGWVSLSGDPESATLERLLERFFGQLNAQAVRDFLPDKTRYEETRIVASWLANPDNAGHALLWRGESPARFRRRLLARLKKWGLSD